MNEEWEISRAERADLPKILELQYLAYQTEAELLGTQEIPPLKQTLAEVESEYERGTLFKALRDGRIVGSVRAYVQEGTVYIGKLIVDPEFRRRGLGKRLLKEVEQAFPGARYELFTSDRSVNNLRLYESVGFSEFKRVKICDAFSFVYLEKGAVAN